MLGVERSVEEFNRHANKLRVTFGNLQEISHVIKANLEHHNPDQREPFQPQMPLAEANSAQEGPKLLNPVEEEVKQPAK